MASTLTSNTFSTTYKDDYKDSDQYYRILFNSGRALQARELTQMQTIIQEEMARFGRNIFVEGAPVRPGGVQITNPSYIKVSSITIPSGSTLSDIVGKTFTVTSGGPAIKVRVEEAIAAENGDPITLYVTYTDTTAATANDTQITVRVADVLTTGLWSFTVESTGRGTKGSVGSGEYFVQGHFVFVKAQTIFISKYTTGVTCDLGFKITQNVITETDNDALYDNQGASPNIAAPGAHRLQIVLSLTVIPETEDVNNNYVYTAKLDKGKIVDLAERTDGYNAIYDLMALRTKEESGNYVVNNYTAKLVDIENNDSNFYLELSRGTAYVDGYRLDTPPQLITIPKARDTYVANNQAIVAQYGNYIEANIDSSLGLPDIDTFDKVDLMGGAAYTGDSLGTARIRAVEEGFFGAINYYLFDIQMGNNSFRDVVSIGNNTTDYVNIRLEDGIAVLKSTANNSLLFNLPGGRPTLTGVSDVSLSIVKKFTFTYSGSAVTLTAGGVTPNQDVFEDLGDWVLATTTGSIVTNATYTPGTNYYTVDVSGIANGDYEVIAKVALNSNNTSIRTKTLQSAQDSTIAWPTQADSDGNGLKWIDIGYADIYEVQAIKVNDSDGNSIRSNFTFDNGQRDNFYAKGRLIAKPGVTIPSGDIFFKYRRFSHSASGNFFNVTSYAGQLDYENIPSYTKSNNETVSLRDVLDFRPVQGTTGEYNTGGGIINLLPQNTDTIRADVEYYLPRKDKITVGIKTKDTNEKYGSIFLTKGYSNIEPQLPEATTGHLSLFNLSLNPYTLGRNDVKIEYIDNRRYTMKDISKLEKRINNIQEITALSLLETSTSTIEVYDSAGNARTKAGFLVDNFSNYAFSDTNNTSYRAAIDQGKNEVTPTLIEKNVRLIYDSASSLNLTSDVIRKGDNLMLPYTEKTYVDFVYPTNVMKVNEHNVILNTGRMTISPASDEWYEVQWAPDIIIDLGEVAEISGKVSVKKRGDPKYQWYGDNEYVITGTETVTEQIDEKVIQKIDIPYMRSIKIYFKASGLRPNAQHFAFFNGISVANWVREETSYKTYSEDPIDYGNTLETATQHPDGPTQLISDQYGDIIGSFVIPSTESFRFHVGTVLFKLIDITDGNNDTEVSSGAITNFSSAGIIEVTQKTFESTRYVDLATYVLPPPPSSSGGDGDGYSGGGGRTEPSGSGSWGDPPGPGGC